jgi:MFS family permease
MDLLNVSNKRRWTIVSLLFTASLINYLDRAAISFALPLISRDFHLTPETKGLLLSSFFWSYALMQIPIGWCAGSTPVPLPFGHWRRGLRVWREVSQS